MKTLLRLAGSSLLGIAGLSAQGTFVVDGAGGAGAAFTSIQTAVTSVPSGSTLLVRPGTYGPVDIVGTSLTILCDPGVFVSAGTTVPYLRVRVISATQSVHVRGLLPIGGRRLRVSVCDGPVVIDGGFQDCGDLSVFRSGSVLLRRCRFVGYDFEAAGAHLEDSTVVFENCVLRGAHGVDPWGAGPGILLRALSHCEAQLVYTNVFGGDGFVGSGSGGTFLSPGGTAVATSPATLCSVRVMGAATNVLASGLTPPGLPATPSAPLVSLRRTAAVQFVPPISTPPVDMPALLTGDAAPGGALLATRYGTVGALCVIAASLPGPAGHVPGVVDPLGLDSASLAVIAAGIAATTQFGAQLPVPNLASLRGITLSWQAAELGPGGIAALSNPSATFVY